jgi:hypothetical protein
MVGHTNAFIVALTQLQNDRDRINQDPDLAQGAADFLNAAGGRPGPLTATNFSNAATVVGAITAVWEGGSPSNESVMFDLL